MRTPPVTNIDDAAYDELYQSIDGSLLIQLFQRVKFWTIFPLLRWARPKDRLLDVGCAKGNLLRFFHSRGYRNLAGLDLEERLYPEVRSSVAFFRTSLTATPLPVTERFDNVLVSCMLHHLPVDELPRAAQNLATLLVPGGQLFVYEPNLASTIGNFFYSYFLRLFPALYQATLDEREQQELFCAAWPSFVDALETHGMKLVKRSEWAFYKVLVARKIDGVFPANAQGARTT